jgi:predicted DNA-binding transcriptional regulator AlpA
MENTNVDASAARPPILAENNMLAMSQVETLLGVSRPTLIRLSKQPGFPRLVRVGAEKWVHGPSLDRWVKGYLGADAT